MGLDPGLGVLHVDTTARDGLACDLMEPCRTSVDAYLLDWITRQPLKGEWFFEERNGNCRLMAAFAARLSETIPTWRRSVAPVAESVAHAFWSTIRRPDVPLATRLTQTNKREAKGSPGQLPSKRLHSQQNVCLVCGKPIERSHKSCLECAQKNLTTSFIAGRQLGRVIAHSPAAQARLKATKRRHDEARSQWSPSKQPAWLTEEVYDTKIQPQFSAASLSQIATALGVSLPYASDIRRGRRRPHPRHWEALEELVGVKADKGFSKGNDTVG